MSNIETKQLAVSLSGSLGKELEKDIEKFLNSVFHDLELSLGERDDYELVQRKVKFTSIRGFDKPEETVVDDRFKPTEFLPNSSDYYFAAEETIRFTNRDTFFGIVGNKWMKNELGDEFVEAIIFGNHLIGSIDCMLGSIQVNSPYNASQYLSPGTLVALRKTEFKKTKYLVVDSCLPKFFTSDMDGIVWTQGNFQNRYFWDGENYTTEPIYSRDDDDFEVDDYEEDDYGSDYDNVFTMCELCRDAGCCLGITNCGFQ